MTHAELRALADGASEPWHKSHDVLRNLAPEMAALLLDMADVLRTFPHGEHWHLASAIPGAPWDGSCRTCEINALLARFDRIGQ